MSAAQQQVVTRIGRPVVDWKGLLAYHDESRWNALLLGPLWECAEAAEQAGCQFRLTREWQRGPHLRLGVRGPVEAAAEARARIDQRLHGILRSSPSARTMTLVDVRDRAQQAADRAGVELREDWLADNSLTWTAGAPDGTWGTDPGVRALLEDFHYAASVPALRLMRAAPEARLGPAFADLMAVTAQEFGRGGLASAAMSFRSHAEAYLNLEAAPDVRAAWDNAARRSAPALRRRLLAVAAGPDRPAYVRDWLEAVTPVVRAAQQAQSRGEFALPAVAGGFSADLTDRSAFHRELAGSARWEDVRSSDWFQIYRFAISLLYLQLSRMGVAPVGRYRLCHLLATALTRSEEPTTTIEGGDR
ncbi:lantibiotic dehydratase C-terminal domain-containing protein [Kitasatospora sp. NPDC049258]|uniref:lantibiotic dehydratase C-terminal domain-containing protein n=1 Tax=Kitasatospora sp. NPDC049258 TaxID=3155394 RepID=UPI0034492405